MTFYLKRFAQITMVPFIKNKNIVKDIVVISYLKKGLNFVNYVFYHPQVAFISNHNDKLSSLRLKNEDIFIVFSHTHVKTILV